MRIDLMTLFPEMFTGVFGTSILKRAAERGVLDIHYTNFRAYATDKHRHVDDTPCGGGAGMVLKPEPIYAAVRDVWATTEDLAERRCTIIFDPAGEVFTQKTAKEFASYEQLILICGHYEGFDARIYELADRLISVGDFVLTGGEIPAMLVVDATARMLPGVLGAALRQSCGDRTLAAGAVSPRDPAASPRAFAEGEARGGGLDVSCETG